MALWYCRFTGIGAIDDAQITVYGGAGYPGLYDANDATGLAGTEGGVENYETYTKSVAPGDLADAQFLSVVNWFRARTDAAATNPTYITLGTYNVGTATYEWGVQQTLSGLWTVFSSGELLAPGGVAWTYPAMVACQHAIRRIHGMYDVENGWEVSESNLIVSYTPQQQGYMVIIGSLVAAGLLGSGLLARDFIDIARYRQRTERVVMAPSEIVQLERELHTFTFPHSINVRRSNALS